MQAEETTAGPQLADLAGTVLRQLPGVREICIHTAMEKVNIGQRVVLGG